MEAKRKSPCPHQMSKPSHPACSTVAILTELRSCGQPTRGDCPTKRRNGGLKTPQHKNM